LSPILVRPVREQLEHDRVIRLLQVKYKRKFDVAINPGNEQAAAVGPATSPWYPDLVLQSGERRKLLGVVEVETAESLNNLEAMSQWVAFSKLRVPFHLYVPASGVDSARRLCSNLHIQAAEMWAYSAIGEQIRFTLVTRSPQAGDRIREPKPARPPAAESAARSKPSRPAASRSVRGAAGSTRARPAVKKKSADARGAKKATTRQAAASKPQKRK
jgi:hypothetical protein